MAVAEGSSPNDKPARKKFFGGAASAASSSSGDAMSAMRKLDSLQVSRSADSPAEALRKLEELQRQNSTTKVAPKPDPALSAPAAARAPVPSITAGAATVPDAPTDDWTCQHCYNACGDGTVATHGDGTVPAGFRHCPTCGQGCDGVPSRHKPPAADPVEEWECFCGEFSSSSFRFCVECGYPAGAEKPPPPDECGGCGETLGESFVYCPDCGTPKGEWNRGAPKGSPKEEDWSCGGCKDGMPADFAFCINCGTTRP